MWGSSWERANTTETESLFGVSESTTQGSYYPLDAKVILREGKDIAYSQKN